MTTDAITIGVDLGGTKVEVAQVDAAGRVIQRRRYPTNVHDGPNAMEAELIDALRQLRRTCEGPTPAAVGVGVAGQVDARSGVVHFAPNLGWREVPLQEELERALELPVIVTNDARAAAWGEWLYGAGQGCDEVVCLFIGTGIGGGMISGGRWLEGCSSMAGELGHITIVADGEPCHCRNRGCLEAYASGWAIAKRAQEAVRADPWAGQTLMALAGSIGTITAATVSQAYRVGNLLARRIIEETGHYLATGVVSLVNAFNPCRVILGGGVIEGLPELIQIVEEEVQARALEAAVEPLGIVKAALDGDAGVIGAAALARDRLKPASPTVTGLPSKTLEPDEWEGA